MTKDLVFTGRHGGFLNQYMNEMMSQYEILDHNLNTYHEEFENLNRIPLDPFCKKHKDNRSILGYYYLDSNKYTPIDLLKLLIKEYKIRTNEQLGSKQQLEDDNKVLYVMQHQLIIIKNLILGRGRNKNSLGKSIYEIHLNVGVPAHDIVLMIYRLYEINIDIQKILQISTDFMMENEKPNWTDKALQFKRGSSAKHVDKLTEEEIRLREKQKPTKIIIQDTNCKKCGCSKSAHTQKFEYSKHKLKNCQLCDCKKYVSPKIKRRVITV